MPRSRLIDDVAHSHEGHGHDLAQGRSPARPQPRPAASHERGLVGASDQRRLLGVMLFGAAILVMEVIAGFLANSLALLSDAAHMSTDVAALALAYAAARIASRPRTSTKSYGYYRAETVAAFVNALALWGITGYFVFEAVQRLREPPAVNGAVVAVVGAVTLGANVIMAYVLHARHHHSMSMRSAYIHVLSDALGSLGALAAGLGIHFFGARWLDPVVTLGLAVLIAVWTWRLTRDSLHILLEGTPARVKHEVVKATIAAVPGVLAVHDLHVWSLTTGMDNLSAHIMVEDATQGPVIVRAVRDKLVEEHHLAHVTIEVETEGSANCLSCD